MGIISGSGSFRGQFGDHFRVGDHFGVGIISGAVQVPFVLILGHSFVKRLKRDLRSHFDPRADGNFKLGGPWLFIYTASEDVLWQSFGRPIFTWLNGLLLMYEMLCLSERFPKSITHSNGF